eukprot:TRINITY_DN2380_c0_g2_i1.p1 TRINITY_DN2380_c0_g2~~TRINITY_DN2380_c0_g2_i1.p1  ORF type:complete len:1192 (-),score=310.39 TRINITY_DN2380_c0_g2_i1:2245-5820(-)
MAYKRGSTPRREKAEKTKPRKVRNGYRSKPFSARLPFSADRESPAAMRSAKPRVVIVAVCFALLWAALWVRAFHVQVVDGPELASKARRQHLTSLTVNGPRGNIYDRTGRVMAKSVELFSAFARPLEMDDRGAVADTIAPILDRTPEQVRTLLSSRSSFVWLDRKISDRVASAIRAADLDGVYLTTEYGRQYPSKHLAGQLLGFVGLDEQGLSGLELAYDKFLAGKNIRLQVQRDAKGNVLRFGHSVDDIAAIKGGDITLTIDAHIQLMAQEELAKAVTDNGGKRGGCLVLDLESNEILAWAQYPFFNPNDYQRYGPSVWRNALAIDAMELGSTMKPFLMAAALQEQVIDKETLFFCENGRFRIGRNTIRDTHEYGWLPAHKILRYSSNIGSAKIAMTMGKKTYHGYLDRLGFGHRTELDLPGESQGILRPPGSWREIDLVTASFGQGFSVTIPQLAKAFSCIANQGVLRPLSLVKKPESTPTEAVRIFSPEVADQVLAMMGEVVEEDGTGTRARIAGMRVGGKTGTAQKASPKGGYGNQYVATFLGLLPIEKPRYLIAVVVDEPQKSHYGGVVSAPAFREIAVKTLAYKGGLPDMPMACENGKANKPSPACKPEELAIAKVKAETLAVEGTAPDVVGMPLRQAVELFATRGAMPSIKGNGEIVAKQTPAPGREWKDASEPTLWLGAAKGKGQKIMLAKFEELLEKVSRGLIVRTHSGRVNPGEAFLALPSTGGKAGLEYVNHAIEQGATWVVAEGAGIELPVTDTDGVRWVLVEDAREALGRLAAAHFHTEALPFQLVGVTGTNGKTTVCHLLEHLFKATGHTTGLLGTIRERWPGEDHVAQLTTPGCWELHERMAAMAGAGVDAAFMEVSSHALDQKRVAGLEYSCAVLTNLSQDHLDYHLDMASYGRAKALLFETCPKPDKRSVINWDDAFGRTLLERIQGAVGYGLGDMPESVTAQGGWGLKGALVSTTIDGMVLEVQCVGGPYDGEAFSLHTELVGEYNASNLLVAMAAGLCLKLHPDEMTALSDFHGVPGRLERVASSSGLNVFVDYAHTPDALDNVLRNLRPLTPGRLITVFGCGGDRDRTKRPLMGQAACKYSDVAVLTSDNPRTEDPDAILEDVKPGLIGCREIVTEVDRRKAIGIALEMMQPGDALLVAGKGHEDYQIIGREKRPFSDQAVIREFLEGGAA